MAKANDTFSTLHEALEFPDSPGFSGKILTHWYC